MGDDAPKETGRLESFSDGVFAIAITLLVLDLRIPDGEPLAEALLHLWPSYLSFALSFLTILVMWTNHHANLWHVRRADGRLLFSNGVLLLFITLITFPTAVLGEHLTGVGSRVAAGLYAGSYLAINLAWIAFWRSIVRNRAALAPGLTDLEVRSFNRALALGFVAYVTATALAWVSAAASVALCVGITALWTVQAIRHHDRGHVHGGPA